MKKLLCNAAIIFAVVLGVVSCENELTPLGSDFLGEDPENIIKEAEFDVKTYSTTVNPVQTNNFNSIPFGTYFDPVYGESKYGFVAQLNPTFSNPDFGENTILEEVILEIPYFSTIDLTVSSGEDNVYVLDSLYGGNNINFEIYRSNYFLSNFDSNNVAEPAVYYSDFEDVISMNATDLIYSESEFIPSAEQVTIIEEDDEGQLTVQERLSPRLRISLPVDYWENVILNQEGMPSLQSISNFQNYFRGLYFKITGSENGGSLIHLNLNQATLTLSVNSDFADINDFDNDGDVSELNNITSAFEFNFNGNRVVFIDHDFPSTITSNINTSNDPINGSENLYLKGGPGALTIIELFGQSTNNVDGESPELTQIIANDWLINEASIDFYVNQDAVLQGSTQPERILIYDYETGTLLSDYSISTSGIAPINANLRHLGRLEREIEDNVNSQGVKYKLTLTQHLNNIIQGETENNRLAIVVSQNVSLITSSEVSQNPIANPELENIPISAAISHEGTVLHGNLSPEIDKRPKLKIFYSETTN